MRHKKELKSKATKLRKKGYSYSIISEKINIPVSTLSYWLSDLDYKPNKSIKERIKKARLKAIKTKKENLKKYKTHLQTKARKEIGTLTEQQLKTAGAALYWGDGRKHDGMVGLVNSDPKMVKFFIIWLRKICKVPIKNIRLEIHLYPDHDIQELTRFWFKITKIPLKQFLKSQVDKRINKTQKKKGKLPYGTAHIYVLSGKEGKYGYKLYNRICGWINAVYEAVENEMRV